ncbi:MAG: hypothetical protein PHC88_05520 [Terrimicrobiaceae bacterium]|nr:hypothetical protein [Terrimicrobiaceae bacterium]
MLGLRALQRTDQEGQAKQDADKQALADQEVIKGLFQQGLSPEETFAAIMKAPISLKTKQSYQENWDKHQASVATANENTADARKKNTDADKEIQDWSGSLFAGIDPNDPQAFESALNLIKARDPSFPYDQVRQSAQTPEDRAAIRDSILKQSPKQRELGEANRHNLATEAGQKPNTPFEVWKQQNPDKPVGEWLDLSQKTSPTSAPNTPFEVWHADNPGKSVDQWLKISRAPTGGGGGDSSSPFKLWQRQHPDGSVEEWFRLQGSGDAKPPTAAQLKMLGFYERVDGALDAINLLEPDIAKMGIIGQTRLNNAPNIMQSSVGQRYNQAKNDFINASLRRESGAAISDGEYARFNSIYFPQPGDDAAVLAQKKKARDTQLKTFKTESGRAYTQAYGEDEAPNTPGPAAPGAAPKPRAPAPPKVGDVQDGHVFMGGNPADPKSWKKKN